MRSAAITHYTDLHPSTTNHHLAHRRQHLTTMNIELRVFWNVTLRTLAPTFRVTYCFHIQEKTRSSKVTLVRNYRAVIYRRSGCNRQNFTSQTVKPFSKFMLSVQSIYHANSVLRKSRFSLHVSLRRKKGHWSTTQQLNGTLHGLTMNHRQTPTPTGHNGEQNKCRWDRYIVPKRR